MAARKDLDRHLQKEALLNVYAVVSAEPLLLSEATKELKSRVLTQAPDFNRDEFRTGEVAIERVIDAATTMPMMAERRWVWLCDANKLKAKDQAPLLAYLDKPSNSSVLLLTMSEIDQRTKLAQKLGATGALFIIEPPRPADLPGWIERRARRHKLEIEPDAATLLGDLLGTDLGGLDMALVKIGTYAGATAITTDHVEAVVAPTKIDTIFKLTDAIGNRDLARASLQLRNILGGGESALLVLSMMARQVRQLLQVGEALKAGTRPSDVAQKVGLRPFVADTLVAQSRHYKLPELAQALDAMGRADLRLKSTKLDPGVVLDQLLVEIITTAASGAPDAR